MFNERFDSGYSRILTSSLRTNAAILSSMIAYGKTEEGKKLVRDIPFKMVRYITQTRKQSGRWENTQENIFCMNALIEYSKAYENVKPDMSILTKLGKEVMGEAIFKDVRDKPVELLSQGITPSCSEILFRIPACGKLSPFIHCTGYCFR